MHQGFEGVALLFTSGSPAGPGSKHLLTPPTYNAPREHEALQLLKARLSLAKKSIPRTRRQQLGPCEDNMRSTLLSEVPKEKGLALCVGL